MSGSTIGHLGSHGRNQKLWDLTFCTSNPTFLYIFQDNDLEFLKQNMADYCKLLLDDQVVVPGVSRCQVQEKQGRQIILCYLLSTVVALLVGGLEHFLFHFIYGLILPLTFIFFKMVKTTNQIISGMNSSNILLSINHE